jgi:predicted esterase
LRRRTRLEWIWFSLALAVVALGYATIATVQYHAKLARVAAESEQNAAEYRENDKSDSNLTARSNASVTPLNSILSLAELDRSWSGQESHFFPSLDIHDETVSDDLLRGSVGHPDATVVEQSRENGRGDLDSMPPQSETHTQASVEREATSPGRPEQALRYDLLVPQGGPRGAPMLMLLHGTGGVRAVWNRWASTAQSRGYIVCLPVASGNGAGDPKSGGTDSRRRWSSVDVSKVRNLAKQLVQSLRADEQRVYVFGHSNGAFFAQETGLRNPDVFSAIVSIGGGCNVWPISEDARRVGVYMIHGTSDRAVPIEVARKSAERLRNAGVSNVILKEYPERGHELFEDEMQAVFDWIENLRQ